MIDEVTDLFKPAAPRVTKTQPSPRETQVQKTTAVVKPPLKPLLDLQSWSDDETNNLDLAIWNAVKAKMQECLERGYMTRSDIIAMSSGEILMLSSPNADAHTFKVCQGLNPVFDRLAKLIESEERIQLAEEQSERLRAIQDMVGDIGKE